MTKVRSGAEGAGARWAPFSTDRAGRRDRGFESRRTDTKRDAIASLFLSVNSSMLIFMYFELINGGFI